MAVEFCCGKGPWQAPEAGTLAWQRTYPGCTNQAATARGFVRRLLGPRCGFDAESIAAELIANAIVHTASGARGGRFTIHVLLGQTAGIAVQDDGGAGIPRIGVHDDGELREGGMGIDLVSKLSLRSGYWGDPHHGHTVWSELRTLTPAELKPR